MEEQRRADGVSLQGALNDARESLSATQDILQIISQSKDGAGPVFDAILQSAARLCDTDRARLVLAKPGDTHQHLAAMLGFRPDDVAQYEKEPVPMESGVSFVA